MVAIRKRKRKGPQCHVFLTVACVLVSALVVTIWLTDHISSASQEDSGMPTQALLNALSNVKHWPPKDICDTIKDSKNRLVILTVNCGYMDMADNFATRLETLGVHNYLFVPLDGVAYQILSRAYPRHTIPPMPHLPQTVSQDLNFTSFKSILWSRPYIIEAFVRKGYSIFLQDVDMVWIRNIWQEYMDSTQQPVTEPVAVQFDEPRFPCPCLMYVTPHTQNLDLLQRWKRHVPSSANEMMALHEAWLEMTWPWLSWIALRGAPSHSSNNKKEFVFRSLPNALFPNGQQVNWTQNLAAAVETRATTDFLLVHANWMVGKKNKIASLARAGLWKLSGKITAADLEQCRQPS